MPHYGPIITPVDSDSLSELGKVTGSAMALAVIAVCFLVAIAPLWFPLFYTLHALDSIVQGYKFSLNPFTLIRNKRQHELNKWSKF